MMSIISPLAVTKGITGNARYMGYVVDLIGALSEEIGFEYIFVPVADNAYGTYNPKSKKWNGIIGELINNVCIHFFIKFAIIF